MKTIAINLAAAWAATISSFQDGDVFRESQIDISMGTVADRLGYLKNAVDGKVAAGDNVTWTGTHNFSNTTVTITNGTWQGAGAPDLLFSGSTLEIGSVSVDGEIGINTAAGSGIISRFIAGNDAAATINDAYDEYRIPTLSGNRVWTMGHTAGNVPRDGARVLVSRSAAGANSLTLQREDTTTLAVIPAAAAGWVELLFTTKWIVSRCSANCTSVNGDVT